MYMALSLNQVDQKSPVNNFDSNFGSGSNLKNNIKNIINNNIINNKTSLTIKETFQKVWTNV